MNSNKIIKIIETFSKWLTAVSRDDMKLFMYCTCMLIKGREKTSFIEGIQTAY